ncbi:MAG: fused MFS/spermidine synthase [Ignavibacteriaceae bacterium]
MSKYFLYLIVFICGGSVLAIEILGTRIIGPFYGVSLFLWSALISITLIALSVGYMIGGRLADKKKSYNVLAFIIFLSGIITLLIPVFRNTVIQFTESMELRTAVLISSFILFFPPLTLLGMVSPYTIKLRTQSLDEIGTRAGDLYAISTIGSVIAALLTGFILIPNIGVIKLTLTIGIVLIITGVLTFTIGKKILVKALSILVILLLSFSAMSFFPAEKPDPDKGLIDIQQSAYGEIRVMEIDDVRFLLIDGGIHTAVSTETQQNILPYAWVFDVTKNLLGYSGDMLLIGLGGGSILRSFYDDNWDIDVVEIDPAVTAIAKKYFNLVPSFDNIYHQDGREFLRAYENTYDLILVDAFGSSSVPFHLTTLESFRLTKSRLQQDGILALNIESIGWNDIIVATVAKTVKQIFSNVIVLPIAEPPDQLGNVIIVASDAPIELKEKLESDIWNPDYRFSANYEKNHAWDNRFIPDFNNVMVLTDDLNPVEIWSERINLESRKVLHELLGDRSFLWY